MKLRLAWILPVIALAGCAADPVSTAPVAQRVSETQIASPPSGDPVLWPSDAPAIHAKQAILIDARTGETLYQKFADTRVQVASTQKILTALLVVERGNLDQLITIKPIDTMVEPTKLYVKSGQSYPRRSLLAGLMVHSENDAAAALARDHSGSVPAFSEAMNRRAWELGARNSRFLNPHGLPAPQYSTARDMARIAFRVYRQPPLRQLMNLQSYTFVYSTGRTKHLSATNKLLARSSIFNGMKTGYTIAAGKCLISSASVNGRDLIFLQYGSRMQYIFNDAETMLQWGMSRGTPVFPSFAATH